MERNYKNMPVLCYACGFVEVHTREDGPFEEKCPQCQRVRWEVIAGACGSVKGARRGYAIPYRAMIAATGATPGKRIPVGRKEEDCSDMLHVVFKSNEAIDAEEKAAKQEERRARVEAKWKARAAKRAYDAAVITRFLKSTVTMHAPFEQPRQLSHMEMKVERMLRIEADGTVTDTAA